MIPQTDTNQLDFDYARRVEEEARESALQRVEDVNSPCPLDRAEADAIKALVTLPELVSADTILPDLSRYGFTDNRAIGAIMRRLLAKGLIAPTGGYRKSQRGGSHLMPKAVYRNALCLAVQPVLPVSFLVDGDRYEVYRFPEGDNDMILEGEEGHMEFAPEHLLAAILSGKMEVVQRNGPDSDLDPEAVVTGITCNKCGNTLPSHTVRDHFDTDHPIHACPHNAPV